MNEQQQPQRKSPRLKGYDYAQEGAYFITICTYERVLLFGDVVNSEMKLSGIGQIAESRWTKLSEHHLNIVLDAYVVMPNHMHGIIFITDQQNPSQIPVGRRPASSATSVSQKHSKGNRSGTLSAIVGGYKSAVTRTINQQMGLVAPLIWQASFHDHIIRNEQALNHIREYVRTNPTRWEEDTFYKG